MKQIRGFILVTLLAFVSVSRTSAGDRPPVSLNQRLGQPPFLVSVVPAVSYQEPHGRGRVIYIATRSPRSFYVVLTNVSQESQAVFETWNSWGYQAVSFEVQTEDGHKVAISKKLHGFRANAPTTFTIAPGEPMVIPISQDEEWETNPKLAITDQKISIKAIYEVKPTPESAERRVWTGRTESKSYDFYLQHP